MTGTREWEYIRYPKLIVSLKNFSRIKILISSIIKPYFENISSLILKISSCILKTILKYNNTYLIINQNYNTDKIHFYNSLLWCLEFNIQCMTRLIYIIQPEENEHGAMWIQ